MTFDHPLGLLLLLTLPALWWLHRRVRAPREVVVSSVAAVREARVVDAAKRPRRLVDVELLCWLTALAVLALAAGGPRVGRVRSGLYVVVDRSASGAALVEGRTLLRRAMDGVQASLPKDAPLLRIVALDDVRVVEDVEVLGESLELPWSTPARPVSVDGLPGSLDAHLATARALGYPGLVLVTDRGVAVPAVVALAGPGVEPSADAAVLAAGLDGEEVAVSFLPHATEEVLVEVSTSDGMTEWLVVPPSAAGTVATERFPAPGAGESLRVSIEPGGASPANDVGEFLRVSGARRVRVSGAGHEGVERVLRAAGIEVVRGGAVETDAHIRIGGAPASGATEERWLVLGAAPGASRMCEVSGEPGEVAAARVVGTGVLAEATPAGTAALQVSGVVRPLPEVAAPVGRLRGPAGELALVFDREIVTTLVPSAPGWVTDPGFAVFVLVSLEHLCGKNRLERRDGVDPRESLRASPVPPLIGASEVARCVRAAQNDPESTSLAGVLAGMGAALLALAAALALRARL